MSSRMIYAPRLSTLGVPGVVSYLDIDINSNITNLRPPSSTFARIHTVPIPSTPSATSRQTTTILSECKSILSESGLKGLWRGTGTAVLQSIPSAGIYMVGYDYLVGVLTPLMSPTSGGGGGGASKGGDGWVDKGGIPFTAGCMARIVSASVVGPLELFRVRLQARPSRESNQGRTRCK